MADEPTDAEQITFIIEELYSLFFSAEFDNEEYMELRSKVGSRFHKRVLQAAKSLNIAS